jgi:DNA-binding transcriptional LysR family regulator
MDELASIRAFIRVAETGSFVAASRALGVSKSVVTKRVNELESRLKSQLLQRSTRQLTLTDTGTAYLEQCVRILSDLEAADTAVSSLTLGLTGSLRVSCIASFTARQLCVDLCAFQQQHPALKLEVYHNDRVYDPIQEGYDICIQPSDIIGDTIARKPIVELRRLLLATPNYLKRFGQPSHPKDVAAHRCAHNSFIQPASRLVFTSELGPQTVNIDPVILSNNIWMIREAILHGDCIGILPTYFVVDELRSGTLIPILERYRVQPVLLSAYFRRSRWMPAKIRLLLNYLAERYGDVPPWERQLAEAMP